MLTKISNHSINHMIESKHLAIVNIFAPLKKFTKARFDCICFGPSFLLHQEKSIWKIPESHAHVLSKVVSQTLLIGQKSDTMTLQVISICHWNPFRHVYRRVVSTAALHHQSNWTLWLVKLITVADF